MSENLLPCPFCGSNPVSFLDVDENANGETYVYCPVCAESYNGFGNVKLANWQSRPLEDGIMQQYLYSKRFGEAKTEVIRLIVASNLDRLSMADVQEMIEAEMQKPERDRES